MSAPNVFNMYVPIPQQAVPPPSLPWRWRCHWCRDIAYLPTYESQVRFINAGNLCSLLCFAYQHDFDLPLEPVIYPDEMVRSLVRDPQGA